MKFSDWLVAQMNEHDLSQSELARKIGLTRQAVNHLLTGVADKPSIETLQKLSEALDVPFTEALRVAYDLPPEAVVETEWGVKMSKRLEKFPPEHRSIAEALVKTLEAMQKNENNVAKNNKRK